MRSPRKHAAARRHDHRASQRAQGALEYALVLGLIAMVVIATLTVLGKRVSAAVCQVSNGFAHGGPVYVWGDNSNGELGNGSVGGSSTTPAAVPNICGADMAAGWTHLIVVKYDNTVWGWGDNSAGELGQSGGATYGRPVQVSGWSPPLTGNIVQVAAGLQSSMALTSDGKVYAWGLNAYGELGSAPDCASAVAHPTPTQITGFPNGTVITAIASGVYTDYALTSTGTVYSWGYDYFGEIGNIAASNTAGGSGGAIQTGCFSVPTPTAVNSNATHAPLTGVASITANSTGAFTAATLSTGAVVMWGLNTAGELGQGTTSQYIAEAVPVGNSTRPGTFDTVKLLVPGGRSTYAVDSGGTTWAWGADGVGNYENAISHGYELGDNALTDRSCPVKVHGVGNSGFLATPALVGASDLGAVAYLPGTGVVAWGDDTAGEAGSGATNPALSGRRSGIAGGAHQPRRWGELLGGHPAERHLVRRPHAACPAEPPAAAACAPAAAAPRAAGAPWRRAGCSAPAGSRA